MLKIELRNHMNGIRQVVYGIMEIDLLNLNKIHISID